MITIDVRSFVTHKVVTGAIVIGGIGALGGCASTGTNVGKNATAGAIEEIMREQSQARADGRVPMQDLAASIVKGTTAELEKPETRAQFGRIVGTATESAMRSALGEFANPHWAGQPWGYTGGVRPGVAMPAPGAAGSLGPMGGLAEKLSAGFTLGMSRQLQIELGPNGERPLGQTVMTVLKQGTEAAILGATDQLAPVDCEGLNARECADRRVRDLSRTAAKGFVEGLGMAIQIPLLIGAFIAGICGALLVLFFARWRRPVLPVNVAPSGPR